MRLIHGVELKTYMIDPPLLLQSQNPVALRDEIQRILVTNGLDRTCYTNILDYTIELFESNGLGVNYYGYHNIVHELEVTYVTLLAAQWQSLHGKVAKEDLPYLFVAALFHDYDPQKTGERPHEEDAVKFVISDEKLHLLLKEADIDKNLVAALILRTTYPWTDEIRKNVEKQIDEYSSKSNIAKDDNKKEHFRKLGWFLSVADRIGGYALGDFVKAMEMAQKNAYTLAWHPYYIVRRSVSYFEDLLNNEAEMCQGILHSLPKEMRKNFMDNVLSFMKLREQEIQIEAALVYDNARFFANIEPISRRRDPDFVKTLAQIHEELPLPLQFKKEEFNESVMAPYTILNTLRLGSENGPIIGFAKGGPLEGYKLRPEINDPNYGMANTMFLEPIAIRVGYWGQRGGREIRLLFTMQAQAKGFKYLTSFALRDVISGRIQRGEQIEFTQPLNPEHWWNYYGIRL